MSLEYRLEDRFTPSPDCSCEICRSFCYRPGWWTVEQASEAMLAGYSNKMMIEISPDFKFAVLSPAFKGCEGLIAINEFSKAGCTFFFNRLCELHGKSIQPLECRVCHHSITGMGLKCHLEIEKKWNTSEAQDLVVNWMELTNFWVKLQNAPDFLKSANGKLNYNKD